MPFDPDAQALLEALAGSAPGPLSELGVDGFRGLYAGMGAQVPSGPDLFSVTNEDIGSVGQQFSVRIYRPNDSADLPAVVYVHGGGWVAGSPDSSDSLCRHLSSRLGAVVVSVDYRRPPEHPFPVPLDDVVSAITWVHSSATSLKIDRDRVAIAGDSAGANLAASATILSRDRADAQLCFQVLIYPATEYAVVRPSWTENIAGPMLAVTDLMWLWGQYLPDQDSAADPRATPSNADLSGLPPTFVATAEFDPVRDDGEHYATLMESAGVDVVAKRYPGTFHGFATMIGVLQRSSELTDDVVAQLSRAFEAPSVPTPASQ